MFYFGSKPPLEMEAEMKKKAELRSLKEYPFTLMLKELSQVANESLHVVNKRNTSLIPIHKSFVTNVYVAWWTNF